MVSLGLASLEAFSPASTSVPVVSLASFKTASALLALIGVGAATPTAILASRQ